MENIDRILKLAGLNEKAGDGGLPPGWKFGTDPSRVNEPMSKWPDRDFEGREPYNGPDDGYFPPEKTIYGNYKQKHKKWPQYDLYSPDGENWQGLWGGMRKGADGTYGPREMPNTKNNGWLATMDLVDADEVTGAKLVMPHNLVDTAGSMSKNPDLGGSYSPSEQAKRAKEFATKMGLKDWDPKQGFDVVAGYIPYALNVQPGEQFKREFGDNKQVRVPLNLFTPEEKGSMAKARWSGSVMPMITIGGYSIFNPGAPKFKDSPDDDDEDPKAAGQAAAPAAKSAAGTASTGSVLNRANRANQSVGGGGGGGGGDDGVYAADAAPGTSLAKIKPIPFDPKVQAMQKAIFAKDPRALSKFGADGKLGPETAAAMAKYPDIANQYIKALMTTGKTIGDTYREVTASKAPTNEGDNIATFEEAAYDHELARIKSLSLLR